MSSHWSKTLELGSANHSCLFKYLTNYRWDTLAAIQGKMDKFYNNHEVIDERVEAVDRVRAIIEEIMEEAVSQDCEEETVMMSATKNVLNLNSAIKLGKDRPPQQNESGYLSELEASVYVN